MILGILQETANQFYLILNKKVTAQLPIFHFRIGIVIFDADTDADSEFRGLFNQILIVPP